MYYIYRLLTSWGANKTICQANVPKTWRKDGKL